MNYKEWAFHDITPIYLQLYHKMLYSILSGTLTIGESIPSIRTMAKSLNINPNTVSKSYKLIKQRCLIKQSKIGTYVVIDNVEYIRSIALDEVKQLTCSYLSRMFELGYSKAEAVELVKTLFENADKKEQTLRRI